MLVLAVLQWRWIGEVSAMERQRMLASLQSAGARFAEDFDREVARAAIYFHAERGARGGSGFAAARPSPLELPPRERTGDAADQASRERARIVRLAQQIPRWQAEAPFPQIVRAVEIARVESDGVPRLARLDASGALAPLPWPEELLPLRDRLSAARAAERPAEDEPVDELAPPPDVGDPSWCLVLPLSFGRLPGAEGRHGIAARSFIVVELDRQALQGELFPELMRRHFGSAAGEDYVVAVVDGREPAPPGVVFRSDPAGPEVTAATADLRLGLFSGRPFDDLRSLARSSRMHAGGAPRLDPPRGRGIFAWTLLARRRDGSLEAAVAAARRRNLEVSAAVLSLIGLTAGILAYTAQRAQRLARQQIEFVAGVSHELNTPLTAIRSAGENLADGVVSEPAQVRRYGALIENEGRRLSSMVGQVLEFAGMQSRRRERRNERVAVAALIDRALADSRWLLEENRVAVERSVAPGLPDVLGDAGALQRALQNLIENAVKYGARASWVGVVAEAGAGGGVDVTVLDRGPGLERAELSHLFEPFFRGRDAAASGVPGSGLGLSLVRHIVESHGGSVVAGPNPQGAGSAFRIHLPPAPVEADAAAQAARPAPPRGGEELA